ncbi:MAG: hypothetical protein HZC28_11995 [Spirochaetes bacterium]|nr:hypothetical protein [Spirochaetota bacterium]
MVAERIPDTPVWTVVSVESVTNCPIGGTVMITNGRYLMGDAVFTVRRTADGFIGYDQKQRLSADAKYASPYLTIVFRRNPKGSSAGSMRVYPVTAGGKDAQELVRKLEVAFASGSRPLFDSCFLPGQTNGSYNRLLEYVLARRQEHLSIHNPVHFVQEKRVNGLLRFSSGRYVELSFAAHTTTTVWYIR